MINNSQVGIMMNIVELSSYTSIQAKKWSAIQVYDWVEVADDRETRVRGGGQVG